MAANFSQMAGAGQMMPQQQQQQQQQRQPIQSRTAMALQQYVYNAISAQAGPQVGWQTTLPAQQRMGSLINLISGAMLANPAMGWQKVADWGIGQEREIFQTSPDKNQYDQRLMVKNADLMKRRQANEPSLQNAMTAQAMAVQQQQAQAQAHQAQIQAQAEAHAQAQAHQQMLLAQNAAMQAQLGRGMAPQQQQPFQHLQHQMQPSPIPQQMPQAAFNLGQLPVQQNPAEQPSFQAVNAGQPRQPGSIPTDYNSLTPQEKGKVAELAAKLMQGAGEQHKQQMRMAVLQKMNPQQRNEYTMSGRDPAMLFYQNQAFVTMKNQYIARFRAQQQSQQQQQQQQLQQQAAGLGQPANVLQQNMQLSQQQQQQQRQMTPLMMNNPLAQQATNMNPNQLFSSNFDIMNDQKAGMLAQEAGQVVVPAMNPNVRNSTPQPIGGLPPQGGPLSQPGANATARPQQLPQGFQIPASQAKLDQGANQAQAQAQMRAVQAQAQAQAHALAQAQAAAQAQGQPQPSVQQKGLPGQPAGLGLGPDAQNPNLLSNLNAPVRQSPMQLNPADTQALNHLGQGMNLGLDPRMNPANQQRPISMSGNVNPNINVQALLSRFPPEQRSKLQGLPPEKIQEIVMRITQTQQLAKTGQAPNMLGQPQQQPQQPQPQPQPPQVSQAMNMPQPSAAAQDNAQQQQQLALQTARQNRLKELLQNPANQAMMDSMDIPPQIGQLLPIQLPPEIKKWGQLKSFLFQQANNSIPPPVQAQLRSMQVQQFSRALERRQQAAAAARVAMGQNGGQVAGPTPGPAPQANMGMNAAAQRPSIQVTAHDLEILRQQHPQLASMNPQMLTQFAMRFKQNQLANALQQQKQQQMQMQMQMAASQPGASLPSAAMATSQPDAIMSGPAQSQPPAQAVAVPQKLQPVKTEPPASTTAPSGLSAPAPPQKGGRAAQAGRGGTASQPATQMQKGIKRPSNDDVTEIPAPTAQQSQGPQGLPRTNTSLHPGPTNEQLAKLPAEPVNKPPQDPISKLTPEQVAKLTPEQRNKFLQARMRNVGGIAAREAEAEVMPDHHMLPAEKAKIVPRIQQSLKNINQFGKHVLEWYSLTQDDVRVRLFFASRAKLLRQYEGKDASKPLKQVLSMGTKDLDQVDANLRSMVNDIPNLAANFFQGQPPPSGSAAPVAGAKAQTGASQTPLSAANLEKQTQALNKLHQRSQGKNTQPPAAPTTREPPAAPFGGQKTPDGQPTYIGRPSVTQENLQLPPPRKKTKTGPQIAAQLPAAIKASASPEIRRQPEPPATPTAPPTFLCPHQDCEMHTHGFPNEAALKAHEEEEHIKPSKDPFKFVEGSLALALGLDKDGKRPTARNPAQDASQHISPPMRTNLSKQGQTPSNKPDSASTPMSRGVSMNRQGSALSKVSDGKAGGPRSVPTQQPTPKPELVKALPEAQAPAVLDNAWAASTIDPQSLMNSLGGNAFGGGVSGENMLYRSLTPNDTPESSKDSGASEPNSDISETANLDIGLSWQPFENDLLVNMDTFSLEGLEGIEGFEGLEGLDGDMGLTGDVSVPFTGWDDLAGDKGLTMDTSLFSMDLA